MSVNDNEVSIYVVGSVTFGNMELVKYSEGQNWLNNLRNGDGMMVSNDDMEALLEQFYEDNF